jgi:hypothetical protein
MRSIVRSVVSLLLIAACAAAMYVWPPTAPSASASTANPAQESVRGKKTEVLKGDAAKLRVLQLLSKNKAFRRAMKDMEKLGKKPNWDLSAVILRGEHAIAAAKSGVVPDEPTMFRRASYAAPQETFYDTEGEMTFVTYDGPEHTWDGTVYAYDYSTGETQVYDGVIYDYYMEDPINWQVTDEIYYPPDGSDPVRSEPCTSDRYCLEQPAYAKNAPRKDSGQPAGRFMKTSFVSTAGTKAAPARPVLNFLGRFFSCFFNAAPRRIGQCPPAARYTTCLITVSITSGICCGRAAAGGTNGAGYCY